MPIISAFDVEAGKRCNFDASVCYVGNSKSVSKTQGNLPLKKKKTKPKNERNHRSDFFMVHSQNAQKKASLLKLALYVTIHTRKYD